MELAEVDPSVYYVPVPMSPFVVDDLIDAECDASFAVAMVVLAVV